MLKLFYEKIIRFGLVRMDRSRRSKDQDLCIPKIFRGSPFAIRIGSLGHEQTADNNVLVKTLKVP